MQDGPPQEENETKADHIIILSETEERVTELWSLHKELNASHCLATSPPKRGLGKLRACGPNPTCHQPAKNSSYS